MKRILIILALLVQNLYAQNSIENIKFEIIKSTVMFYTTDPAKGSDTMFHKVSQLQLPKYDSLVLYSSKIATNLDGFVTKWQKLSLSNQGNYEVFVNTINKDVFEGEDKEGRKNWPGYAQYQEKTDKLYTDLIDIYSNKVKKDTGKTAVTGNNNNGNNAYEKTINWPIIISAIILVISAVLCFLMMGIKKDISNTHKQLMVKLLQSVQSSTPTRPDIATDAIRNIENGIAGIAERITNLESVNTSILARLNAVATENTGPKNQYSVNNPVQKKFAKIINGDGAFSNLEDEQNGEQIYEISINDDTATYVVTSNENAQKYAIIGSASLLDDGCIYTGNRSRQSRIVTEKPGELQLTLDRSWKITSKAKIKFT